jgi:hypothetical protein
MKLKTLEGKKTSHVYIDRLGESILLKYQYYPKQSTDLMKSPPKYQWHSS